MRARAQKDANETALQNRSKYTKHYDFRTTTPDPIRLGGPYRLLLDPRVVRLNNRTTSEDWEGLCASRPLSSRAGHASDGQVPSAVCRSPRRRRDVFSAWEDPPARARWTGSRAAPICRRLSVMGCRLLLAILLLPLALGASGPGRGDTLQQHYEGDYDDYDDDDDDDVQQEVSHDRLVSGYPVGPSDARASPGPVGAPDDGTTARTRCRAKRGCVCKGRNTCGKISKIGRRSERAEIVFTLVIFEIRGYL